MLVVGKGNEKTPTQWYPCAGKEKHEGAGLMGREGVCPETSCASASLSSPCISSGGDR